MLTALAADARLVIGQVAAGDKETKIVAARSLLGMLDLDGALVTGDALHCQGKTAGLIRERGGDSVFTRKANRPTQHVKVAAEFADPQSGPEPEHVTADADHGRIEVRPHVVSHEAG